MPSKISKDVIMFPFSVEASKENDPEGKDVRIKSVAATIDAYQTYWYQHPLNEQRRYMPKIYKIVDHKGSLLVYWREIEPQPHQREDIKAIWLLYNECDVHHYVVREVEEELV